MRKLVLLGETESEVIKHLQDKLELANNNSDVDGAEDDFAYVIDFKAANSKSVTIPKEKNVPVIMLNTHDVTNIDGCLAVFPADTTIVYFQDNHSIMQILDPNTEVIETLHSMVVTPEGDVVSEVESKPVEIKSAPIPALSASELAEKIEMHLEKFARQILFEKIESIYNSAPINLPKKQFNVQHVVIKDTPGLDGGQTATNEVVVELLLCASFNPFNKYLRVRTMGAGFNPGKLIIDQEGNRQSFHNTIKVLIETKDTELTTYKTSPQNVSGVTNYTVGSEFSVGVNISLNPGFSVSYSISEQTNVGISDFEVINKSCGKNAYWDFQYGHTKNGGAGAFATTSFGKIVVKELPNLAKYNLTPQCEVVYMAPGDFCKTVPCQVGLSAIYGKAVSIYECLSYKPVFGTEEHAMGRWMDGNDIKIDFSKVKS